MPDNTINPDLIIGLFPDDRDQSAADMDRYLLLAMEFDFSATDHVKRKNEIVRDPVTHSPLSAKKVIADYFAERGWSKKPDTSAQGVNTLSAFQRNWKEANPGKDENGPEFQTAIAAHAKNVQGFDWYK